MLVLKFIKEDSSGRHVEVSLDCARVSVTHCSDGGFIIAAYETLTHAKCVEYQLSLDGDPNDYRTCFVINENGKTVDKYIAYKIKDTVAK